MDFGRVQIKKLVLTIGIDPQGRSISTTHVATENKKMWVMPGRYATIEMTNAGVITTCEIPLGPFGWEYDKLS